MTAEAERLSGVLCPVVTPFGADLDPDPAMLATQCRWLLSQDCGLAVFGTNSEANSLSVPEKTLLLSALVEAGIEPGRLLPGTGCCALPDTVKLTRLAVELGCAGVLMLPPFYYKGVSDDGLYASYSEVIERIGDRRLRIYLYHIPPVSGVGLSADLIGRLIEKYPGTIAGIKDSSGDWDNTAALHDRQWDDFRIFAGSEDFLLRNMQRGGAGCISATANVNPAAIVALYRDWRATDADARQAALTALRALVQRYPMIPALKAIVAHYSDRPSWRRVRPPLVALGDDERRRLVRELAEQGFDMPGLAAAV